LSPGADLQLPWVVPDSPLYRIGRKPDAWRAPDWAFANQDKTFGNRFDDSEGYFRVLYASSTRLGCFLETLARFRKAPASLQLAQDLEEIINTSSDFTPPNTVPASWLKSRIMGRAIASGDRYALIYSSAWLSYLRKLLEPDLVSSGLLQGDNAEFDIHFLMSQNRWLTQRAATEISALGYCGVCYESRHGTELVNWALFEPFQVHSSESSEIGIADADLLEAVGRLDLRIDPQF
jgi:hypothetical protein